MDYYLQINGQKVGPYSMAQLQGMVRTGALRATAMACKGRGKWMPVEQLPGFHERAVSPSSGGGVERPLIVWVLTGLYMLGAGLLAFVLIYFGNFEKLSVVETNAKLHEFVQKAPGFLSILYYVLWGCVAYNVIVGLLFFFLTRVGYYLMIFPYYLNLFLVGLQILGLIFLMFTAHDAGKVGFYLGAILGNALGSCIPLAIVWRLRFHRSNGVFG